MSRGSGVSVAPAWLTANLLTVGEENMLREFINTATVSQTSGVMRLTYFTARKTETTTQVRVLSGGTAAGATPTLCRIGLYSIDAAGAGTLVAATASDTTLFAGANLAYTRAWAAPYNKVAGQRYAIGTLVVTAATAPTLCGHSVSNSAEAQVAPAIAAALTAQADLPASYAAGSLTSSSLRPYAALLP